MKKLVLIFVVMLCAVGAFAQEDAANRSDIENALIAKFRADSIAPRRAMEVNSEYLVPYADSLYILPGESYLKKDIITRNAYFAGDSVPAPVWSAEYPPESLANLFVYPSDAYGRVMIEVKFVKHEYGESETVEMPLNTLLGVAEEQGCVTFWGLDNIDDAGAFEGALFLVNQPQGYDHVIRVKGTLDDAMNQGTLHSTAGLFIPTNNVDNMFAPYVKKTDEQKINYNK